MQLVSKSQFKSQLLEYLRRVEQDKKSILITHRGKPVAKVSPYKEDADKILQSLHKSVLTYKNPLESIEEDEWEGLR